ncbi:hypothetical protein EXU48_03405 [Occultella glacieicola]|uniref:Uncharacterized protein n=1 Tax=Occultella glacieicola TaxID=2518684 RepID=A0ABY2E8F5_9MICO|nr:hypothetical protein EXU48_03405 [Occultella glacieicola]
MTNIFQRQQRALVLAAAGTWRPLLHEVPFAEAARAHPDLEARATTGKVVLLENRAFRTSVRLSALGGRRRSTSSRRHRPR